MATRKKPAEQEKRKAPPEQEKQPVKSEPLPVKEEKPKAPPLPAIYNGNVQQFLADMQVKPADTWSSEEKKLYEYYSK